MVRLLFFSGKCGVSVDWQTSFTYLQGAAHKGFAVAQYHLGCLPFGTTQIDPEKSLSWLMKAIKQNYPPAMLCLGLRHLSGVGVTQDFHQAISWIKTAANQGHGEAATKLGDLLFAGSGVTIVCVHCVCANCTG